jgi:hypothetical protein
VAIPEPLCDAARTAEQPETNRKRQRQLIVFEGVNIMSKEFKSPNRKADTPSDKPRSERTEHANLDRPGAQAHPVARGWTHGPDANTAWRTR